MLIRFSVSNFLSFNHTQTLSMNAGKARIHKARVYDDGKQKLTKCQAIFGSNASGKSNLVDAFRFMKRMVLQGLPRRFSDSYFRMNPENEDQPTTFEIELLLDKKPIVYGFSILLKSGELQEEHLQTVTASKHTQIIFQRDLANEEFTLGKYIKQNDNLTKLMIYGEDSISDKGILFLTIMNNGKERLYQDNEELQIFRKLYQWFQFRLIISSPDEILAGYPYLSEDNMKEIANILSALGTGISDVKIVNVPKDQVQLYVPDEILTDSLRELEKQAATKNGKGRDRQPKMLLRSPKNFYTIELDNKNEPVFKTIEFSHENRSVYFHLQEESDGTARLLDLIELLLPSSRNNVYVIDEIDRCLHPAMTVKILEIYLQLAEKRNTQLIVTTHESQILDKNILRNDEICFTLKNDRGETLLNPLEAYHLRPDKRVYSALFNDDESALSELLPQWNDHVLSADKLDNIDA